LYFSGSMRTLLTILFLSSVALAQERVSAVTDSLEDIVSSDAHDTIRINALIVLGTNQNYTLEGSVPYFDRALNLSLETGYIYWQALSEKSLGAVYFYTGNYDKCLVIWERSLVLYQAHGDPQNIANANNNLGTAYKKIGEFGLALDRYYSCLEVSTALGNKRSMAAASGNIGIIYQQAGQMKQAIEFHESSLALDVELENNLGIAITKTNLAAIQYEIGNYENALSLDKESLTLYLERDDWYGIAESYINIGNTYLASKNIDKALENLGIALEKNTSLQNNRGIGTCHHGLGEAYFARKEYALSKMHQIKAYEFIVATGDKETELAICRSLYHVFEQLGDHQNALKYHVIQSEIRDTMMAQAGPQHLLRRQLEYQFGMERVEDSVVQFEHAAVLKVESDAETARADSQEFYNTLLIVIGSLVIVLFGYVVFIINRGARSKGRDNAIIMGQKEMLEYKNEQITSSIEYAKRIQNAYLPPNSALADGVTDQFILYRPKDIISGDFYWSERLGDKFLFSVADCTGHGVPGALLSIIGANALDAAVKQDGHTSPNKILDSVDAALGKALHKEDAKTIIRDGMDVTVGSIDLKTGLTEISSAMSSYFIARGGVVERFKGDRHSIGSIEMNGFSGFTNQTFDLQKGDRIYLFSDGFIDQFRLGTGKKLKMVGFKEVIENMQDLSITEQRKKLRDFLEYWKGSGKQTDDICVMALEI